MIKLEDLLKEAEQEQLDEASLKSWVAGAAMGLGSLFSSGKAQTTDTLKLNMSTLFPSGKHIIHDETKLRELEAQIAGFMSKDPTADYTFRITAMSSKVPDYDGEKPNKPKVDSAFLPHERANEVKEDLENFVQNAKQNGVFKGNVDFQIEEKPGQGPEWHPEKGDKKDDNKFTQHQGVTLDVISHTKDIPVPDTTTTDYQAGFYERTWVDGAPVAFTYATYKSGKGALNTGVEDVLIRFFDIDKISASKDKGLPAYGNAAKVLARDLYTTEAYLIPGGVFNKQAGKKSMGRDELSKFKIYKLKSVNASPDGNISVTYEKSTEERNAHTEDVLGK